jgi:hypothetical protein
VPAVARGDGRGRRTASARLRTRPHRQAAPVRDSMSEAGEARFRPVADLSGRPRPSMTSSSGRRSRPTMRQVATLAGVSTTTVSRVVNGEEVDADMAARVRNAIDLLGYQRDLTASTLRRADRQSATIGLVLEDVSNPFFSALYRAVGARSRRPAVRRQLGRGSRPRARARRRPRLPRRRRLDHRSDDRRPQLPAS